MFDRIRNLVRISKVYGLLRDGLEHREKLESPAYWKALIGAILSIVEVQEMLKGYKTYIVALLMGAVQAAKTLGYIDEATADMLMKLLGAGAVATVAAKINRLAQR